MQLNSVPTSAFVRERVDTYKELFVALSLTEILKIEL